MSERARSTSGPRESVESVARSAYAPRAPGPANATDAAKRSGTWRSALAFPFRELAIRLSLRSANSRWRDPTLYAHELVGDDFWILAGRWDSYCKKIAQERIHPLLGWSQGPITPENPLGLVPWTTRRLVRDGRRKLLFYGDSYVGGDTREEHWMPQLIEERLADVDVLHLGVGGYGPDQMHLLARETLPLVDAPRVLMMGVMSYSFDRAAQRVRSYQKPCFELRGDGSLELANLPICRDPRAFFAKRPTSFRSYLRAASSHPSRPPERDDFGFEAKVPVNRAIIAANRRLAREAGAHLLYVLFHDHDQLHRPTSRDRFFREELAAQGVDAIDTAEALLEHARLHGTDASELYRNGHHNEAGNRVVARAVARALERYGIAPIRDAVRT